MWWKETGRSWDSDLSLYQLHSLGSLCGPKWLPRLWHHLRCGDVINVILGGQFGSFGWPPCLAVLLFLIQFDGRIFCASQLEQNLTLGSIFLILCVLSIFVRYNILKKQKFHWKGNFVPFPFLYIHLTFPAWGFLITLRLLKGCFWVLFRNFNLVSELFLISITSIYKMFFTRLSKVSSFLIIFFFWNTRLWKKKSHLGSLL